ncbi:accessory Sec system S-layer assembly protein [Ornithinibacillus californiensis]|uniref:accessory Sec system S-layer assembly protein n=1 Tax=Ornithinibacillus californiensis TaxID=161536 RepID=UPI00064DB821|nr:accessory Sec system S-layer assembly protein [Ornithinibacillus californiensis]
MLGFSRNKKGKNGKAVDANALLDVENVEETDEEVETTLSIPENWNVTNEDRYIYAFHNNEAPKLKVNQISIYGMELTMAPNKTLTATGLIRSSVVKEVQFGKTTILLLGPDNEIIARKEFELGRLGSIPSKSARPWKFTFNKSDLVKDIDSPPSDWTLAFELKPKHQLDLEESWEKSIAEEAKTALAQIVNNAPPLKPGEVNFMGVNAKRNDNGDLAVTLLIRNGSDKNVTFQQIPLGVKDASGNEIVQGSFKVDNLIIKSNTSKPWTFIFPKSMLKEDIINLSSWQAYPIQ